MYTNEWKNYFLNEKRNVLLSLNWTDEEIIAKYEQDLKEHKESLPNWVEHNMGTQKNVLIDGLEMAIYHMKEYPNGNQISFI